MGNAMTDFNGPSSLEQMGAVGQVVTYVKEAIQAGKYSVGDKLPNEAELAKLAGVGRSSLREGMRILAAYGVVEIRQGEGTFVIDKTAEQFFEFLGYMPSTNFESFIDLRRVIETGNIVTIYDKLDDKELDELQALVDQLRFENGLEACVQADREFHKQLLAYTGNPLMIQIDKMIYRMRSQLLYKIMCDKKVVQDARSLHQQIVNALRAKDKIRCLDLVTEHLNITEEHVERLHLV
jgi:GntR family transcriptional repressor for pyruvate dehydrogenase complex